MKQVLRQKLQSITARIDALEGSRTKPFIWVDTPAERKEVAAKQPQAIVIGWADSV